MSRFVSQNVYGNVHSAVQYVNENPKVGLEVFQFIPVSSNYTIVVYKIQEPCDDRR